jgi:ribosomal protein S18 acetylase RimI-like enzyme
MAHARPSAQVAPEYRRQGLALKLMGLLEEITIKRRAPTAAHTHTCCCARAWSDSEGFAIACAAACSHARCRCAAHARHDGYFVDLFVRKSNAVAIGMYEKARTPHAPHTSMHAAALLPR